METEKFITILHTLEKYRDSEKIALICGDEKLTYRQLIADSKHIARGLVAEGVKNGERVLFCMRRTANAIRALFGILYAGCSYVAADPDWPQERLNFVSKDAATVFSMTDETCARLREKEPTAIELPNVKGEDEAAIYFTSGSTGQPKGVVLHHAVFASITIVDSTHGANWEIFQSILKFPFIGSFMVYSSILASEKTLLLATEREQNSIELLADSIERNHADSIDSTPSLLSRFLENRTFARAFSNFNYVIMAGEKLIPSVVEKISQAMNGLLILNYGSSEMFHCAEYVYRNDGKIYLGKAAYGVKLYILNEKMEEILPGQEGELFIGGTPAKYGHYLNRPDLNAEKYLEHPKYGRLFRTGDMARLEKDGEITLIGRKDGMIKLHGQRIEIGEIENAITSFSGVRCAAVTIQKFKGQDTLCGFYTADKELDDRELRRHLAKHLPMYMIPAFLRHILQMPENANGKLNYRALPAIESDKPLVSVLTPIPNFPLELLKRAYRSVMSQDYDSERIEWFIAVHNMDNDYLAKVRETVGESPHIHVFPVQEPTKTIRAVRNALLEQATGRYLFWLDADDELMPSCISRAVEFMEQSRADMLLFPCEQIIEEKTLSPSRRLNFSGNEPVYYNQGDPGLSELLTGCGVEIWSWCFRISFLRENEIHFDEVVNICEPFFMANILILARRVAVLSGVKGYRYYVHKGSSLQNKLLTNDEGYKLCLEMILALQKTAEKAKNSSFNFNQFMWFLLTNMCFIFQNPDVESKYKQDIHKKMIPYVQKLQVLAPCPAVPKERARQLTDLMAFLFPEASEEFKNPRWSHKQLFFKSLPALEKITATIRELNYIGFKTLPDGANVYLGKVDDASLPQVVTVDLSSQGEKQKTFMQGYRKIEELRGFEPQEIPCRITRFKLDDKSGEILITWDKRFLHRSAVEWLLKCLVH